MSISLTIKRFLIHCIAPSAVCLLLSAYCFLPTAYCFSPFAFQQSKVVDQILMLVNNDVITRSDVLWNLAIDPKAPNPAEGVSSDILRQKLDVLIDQQLILQEAQRIPS